MNHESVESAFARFCEECDPAAMAEVFDRTAGELLPLARRLTRGRVEADDLIQETFLAAIENRASFDPARALMPWLVGILVRQASAARRRARRELDPVRFDSKSQPSPDSDAEASEFQTLVMEALSRLSRHDRDVLVPLLFDGKRAVQIARELGSRPDTIRMRIHRGLDRLRRLLPAGVALPGFLDFGRNWSNVRASVLSRAAQLSHAPVPISSAVSASGILAGAWIALALVATLVVAWSVQGRGSITGSSEATPLVALDFGSSNSRRGTADGIDLVGQRESVAALAGAPTKPAAARDSIWLSGTVRGVEPREFAAVRIDVAGLGPEPISSRESGNLRADSSFEIEVTRLVQLGARRFLVRVDHPDHSPAQVRIEFAHEPRLSAGTLTLQDAHNIVGRVLAKDGQPQGAAKIGLFSIRGGTQDVLPVDVASTDAQGRFHLRSESTGAHALIAYYEDSRPTSRLVDLTPAALDVGELRLEPGLTIAGAVQAATDVDLSGARVLCETSRTPGERRLRLGDRRFIRIGDSYEYATTLAACDAQGRFAVNGLGAQACDIAVLDLGDVDKLVFDPKPSIPEVGASAVRAPRFDLKLELPWSEFDFECAAAPAGESQDQSRLEGVAIEIENEVDSTSTETKPASLRLRPRPGEHVRLQVRPGAHYQVALVGCTRAGAHSFLLEALARGRSWIIPLELSPIGKRATLVLQLVGEDLTIGDRIGLGFFTPAVDDAGASPLFERSASLDASNRASFSDLPPGLWHARVRAGGTYSRSFGFILQSSLDLDLAAGSTIERAVQAERGGRARLVVHTSSGAPMTSAARLFDAAGREHELQCIALEAESSQEQSGRIVFNSPNELGPLPAGSWRLELNALWHQPLTIPFTIEVDRVSELNAQLIAR